MLQRAISASELPTRAADALQLQLDAQHTDLMCHVYMQRFAGGLGPIPDKKINAALLEAAYYKVHTNQEHGKVEWARDAQNGGQEEEEESGEEGAAGMG